MTRLDDLPVLADIARTDPDEDVRADAVRGLAGLAAETDDDARATDAVRHLIELGRTREVVVVARENPHLSIRSAVVDLLDETKALGSISRHAADAQTRLRALARLSDAGEILNVALKSEHTDTAVAALERVDDEESLSAISQRARNKVAGARGASMASRARYCLTHTIGDTLVQNAMTTWLFVSAAMPCVTRVR